MWEKESSSANTKQDWQQVKSDLNQITNQLVELSAFLQKKRNELSCYEAELTQKLAQEVLKNAAEVP